MKFEEAAVLADRIVHCIEHLCDKVQVVGSIRRKRSEVHDIDMVLIPQSWMWNTIIQRLKNTMLADVVKAGPELVTLKIPRSTLVETIQVDIYKARPETWGVLLLIRTGSKEHNIKLCSRARAMGLMLSAAEGVIKDGKVVASRTEAEIFAALGLAYVEPKDREV